MSRKFTALLIVYAFYLSACGGDRASDSEAIPPPRPSDHATSTRASRLGDEFTLSCAGMSCPDGTGALFLATYSVSGLCTTWIAGETEGKTVVMTNKHCVSKVTDCAEELAFRFPATKESAQCERILKVSEFALDDAKGRPVDVPDYAIILLNRKLKAQPLPLSQSGIMPKSQITIRKAWSIDYRSIEMREEACEIGAPNGLTPNFTGAIAPNASLYGCRLKSGVSGAPIFNTKGEAVGIVQIGSKGISTVLPPIPGLDSSEFNIDKFGVATNLACIDFPGIGLTAARQGCSPSQSREQEGQKIAEGLLSPSSLTKGIIDRYKKFIDDDSAALFGWTVRADDGQRVRLASVKGILTLEMTPKCVTRIDEPVSRLEKDFRTQGFFGGWQSRSEVIISSPGWTIGLKVDKYGAFGAHFRTGSKTAVYKFSPADFANLKDGENAAVIETVDGRSITMSLPLCKRGFVQQDRIDAQELQELARSGDDEAIKAAILRMQERNKGG